MMTFEKTPQLSLNEFTILGLVSESKEPLSGSDLEAVIKARGMRNWTNIGKSSVYHSLKKLEKMKFIKLTRKIIEKKENLPPKKKILFSVTDIGYQKLGEEVQTILIEPTKVIDPFVISLSNSLILTKAQLIEALKKRVSILDTQITWLSNTFQHYQRKDAKGFSITGEKTGDLDTLNVIRAIFNRPLKFVKCEKEWVNALLKEIEKKEWYIS